MTRSPIRLVTLLLAMTLATPALAKPKPVARAVVDDLGARRYAAVIARLSPTLAEQLDEAGLQRAWESAQTSYGAFQRRKSMQVSEEEANGVVYTVVDVACQGELSEFRVRVTLDGRERVAGLFFLPPVLRFKK